MNNYFSVVKQNYPNLLVRVSVRREGICIGSSYNFDAKSKERICKYHPLWMMAYDISQLTRDEKVALRDLILDVGGSDMSEEVHEFILNLA